MSEKLTVEELVKTLRCCASRLCSACPASGANCVGGLDRMRQTADALESLTAERDGYREQLAAALAENTKLARQLAVKSEQLESLRTIFYEITGSIPSKAHSQKASKEENHA